MVGDIDGLVVQAGMKKEADGIVRLQWRMQAELRGCASGLELTKISAFNNNDGSEASRSFAFAPHHALSHISLYMAAVALCCRRKQPL